MGEEESPPTQKCAHPPPSPPPTHTHTPGKILPPDDSPYQIFIPFPPKVNLPHYIKYFKFQNPTKTSFLAVVIAPVPVLF